MVEPRQSTRVVKALRRIGPAYEQIQAQLRDAIVSGEIGQGARLPTEADLASAFGVSRATVREALRGLSAEGLIVTTKGPTGGSFVAQPSIGQVTDQFRTGMSLIARSNDLSLDDFHDLRRFLEVPACRLAAERRTEEDLTRLRASAPVGARDLALSTEASYLHAKDFHDLVVETAHNPLLTIATEPVFMITQTRLNRNKLTPAFHKRSNADHREIVDAIADGDGDAAAKLMERHLDFVRKHYRNAWIPEEEL